MDAKDHQIDLLVLLRRQQDLGLDIESQVKKLGLEQLMDPVNGLPKMSEVDERVTLQNMMKKMYPNTKLDDSTKKSKPLSSFKWQMRCSEEALNVYKRLDNLYWKTDEEETSAIDYKKFEWMDLPTVLSERLERKDESGKEVKETKTENQSKTKKRRRSTNRSSEIRPRKNSKKSSNNNGGKGKKKETDDDYENENENEHDHLFYHDGLCYDVISSQDIVVISNLYGICPLTAKIRRIGK